MTEANTLVSQLRKAKQLHDSFGQEVVTLYQLSGKTIQEWEAYFKTTLPIDPNPATLMSVDSRLMDLHHEASFFKSKASLKLQAGQERLSSQFREKFTDIVGDYKKTGQKLPSRDTLTQLAEETISDLKSMVAHSEIELEFWKEILSYLGTCRRLVENATLNVSVEAKANQNNGYLEALSRKNGATT